MSSEKKIPLNLYGILDNELQRMHALLLVQTNAAVSEYGANSGTLSSYRSFQTSNSIFAAKTYERIVHMQDLLLTAITTHDEAVQEKVAELALTGAASSENQG